MKLKELIGSVFPRKFKLALPVLLEYISSKLNIRLPKKIQKWSNFVSTDYYANSKINPQGLYNLETDELIENILEENKRFFSRHLPAKEKSLDKDNLEEVTDLFCRDGNEFREGRSNLFFAYFAQWFTDGFFRSSLLDPRQTGSSHEVDLCQIYGQDDQTTSCLRDKANGYLKSEGEKTNEVLPNLFYKSSNGYKVSKEFSEISYLRKFHHSDNQADKSSNASNEFELIIERMTGVKSKEELKFAVQKVAPNVLATGLERGNATLGNLALTTLFLRSHNRICDDLAELKEFSEIEDQQEKSDKIFHAAREINIVVLIKLTIEEYINHIAGRNIFMFDPMCAHNKSWNKKSWLSAEFNLLYRWHGLLPNNAKIKGGKEVEFRDSPSKKIAKEGLSDILQSACEQASGRIQAGNTPPFLRDAEKQMIKLGRDWKLQPYNEYRKAFGLKPLKSISKLTSSKRLQRKLEKLYGDINKVEFVVGLFIEDQYKSQLVGELQSEMVAYDAFTFLYSNPLLEKEKYELLMSNPVAYEWIKKTNTIDEFVAKVHSSEPMGKFHFKNESQKSNIKLIPISKGTELRGTFENTLCPHLRIGIRTGNLTPNESGWVEEEQLTSFFKRVGIKPKSILTRTLLKGGSDFSPFNPLNRINLSSFRHSFLDHGSSTGILNNTNKLSSSRLAIFKEFATRSNESNELRLYKKQYEKVADELHKNPREFKAGFRGQLLQLVEFRIINQVYGRWDPDRKEKYLTYDDIVSIWKYARPPKGWQYAEEQTLGFYWSVKAFSASLWHFTKRHFSSYFNKGAVKNGS